MASNSGIIHLSVLDQSPVSTGMNPSQALAHSIGLARHVDALGYRRFWMSEHHAMDTLACTAPEIMIARIGAETRRIRIGAGGIMLPHYTALKVAECFRMLHALYPGRVDLGIGRAPGGGPVEALALKRDRATPMQDDFGDQISELIAFLDHGFPGNHPFSRIRVAPDMPGSPDVWMLGSSMWSAAAAAEFGLPYSFAHFFSPVQTRPAIEAYKRSFLLSGRRDAPEAMVAVGVICADTQEEAEFLHASVRLLQWRIRQNDRRPIAAPGEAMRELKAAGKGAAAPQAMEEGEWPRYFVGTPAKVRSDIESMSNALGLAEVMVNTITFDHAARLHSYDLLAAEFGVTNASGEAASSPA